MDQSNDVIFGMKQTAACFEYYQATTCSFMLYCVTVICFNSTDRAVKGEGLRPLDCWDCGFESCRGHGCMSLVSVCVVR